jgi:hypothetical protein
MPRVSGSAWPWLLADDSDAIVGIRSGDTDQLFVFSNDDALNIDMSNLAATWNGAGTTYTAVKMNVTDTASAAGSLLLDLQVGGTSQFSVTKAGQANLPVSASSTAPGYAFDNYKAGIAYIGSTMRVIGGNNVLWANIFSDGIQIGASTAQLYFGSDTILTRDAANTLAQRNATNPQTLRVYNTYSSATNYQCLGITSATTTLSGLSGASVTATNLIPAGAVVVGVTTRVSTEVTGASGYQVGTVADPDRWGDITGVAVGTTSDNTNWTAGTIECFTAATDVVITAKTSNFTAGALVLTVHYLIGQAD